MMSLTRPGVPLTFPVPTALHYIPTNVNFILIFNLLISPRVLLSITKIISKSINKKISKNRPFSAQNKSYNVKY